MWSHLFLSSENIDSFLTSGSERSIRKGRNRTAPRRLVGGGVGCDSECVGDRSPRGAVDSHCVTGLCHRHAGVGQRAQTPRAWAPVSEWSKDMPVSRLHQNKSLLC